MMYEQQINTFGKSSCDPINSGLQYARALKYHHHGVKSERLLMELYEISLQNHGADHEITQRVSSLKNRYFARVVSVAAKEAGRFQSSQALSVQDYNKDNAVFYQLRQYNESFERCIVKGPLIWSSTTTNNEISLSSDDIIFALGTPVICSEDICPHSGRVGIEGQLGDVRSWNSESKCYTIHWEDESLEPCEVHQCYLRAPSYL